MPDAPSSFAHRVNALRRDQLPEVVDWVARRVIENIAIDASFLKDGIERAIDWSGVVVDAAVANLGRRGWTKTQTALERRAGAALVEARTRKTDGPKGMPLLLKSAYSHIALIDLLGSTKARLVDADLSQEMKAGLVLLGEVRGEAIYRAVRELGRGALLTLQADVAAAGERSLAIAPEPIGSPAAAPGGGTLSQEERRLVGHWVNTEFLSGTTGKFELHMVLLATGQLARTKRSVVFAPLRDSGGNWVGSLDSVSGLSRAERGRWNAAGLLLTLEMDDGSAYEYRYEQDGASLLTTNTNGGARRYWTRS